jgi:hypothetical protein
MPHADRWRFSVATARLARHDDRIKVAKSAACFMGSPIECVKCYNWGSTDEPGWTSMFVDGRTEWHCPNCLHVGGSTSLPASPPIARIEPSLPLAESLTVAQIEAATATTKPMQAVRRTFRERWNSIYWEYGDEFTKVRIALGFMVGAGLLLGAISGVINGDFFRAVLAVLGGSVVAGTLLVLVVVAMSLAGRGRDSWFGLAGLFLTIPTFFALLAVILSPFVAFAPFATNDFPSALSAFSLGAFYVGVSAVAGLPIQIVFLTIGMMGHVMSGGRLAPRDRVVVWILASFYALGVISYLGALVINQQIADQLRQQEYERYEEEIRLREEMKWKAKQKRLESPQPANSEHAR